MIRTCLFVLPKFRSYLKWMIRPRKLDIFTLTVFKHPRICHACLTNNDSFKSTEKVLCLFVCDYFIIYCEIYINYQKQLDRNGTLHTWSNKQSSVTDNLNKSIQCCFYLCFWWVDVACCWLVWVKVKPVPRDVYTVLAMLKI